MHIFHLKITIIIWDTEVHFIMFRVMPKTRLAFSKFCFENHFIDPFTPRPPLGEFIATLTFNCGRNFVVSPIKWNLFRRTFVPGLAIAITDQEIMWWELVKWSPQGKCFDLWPNSLNQLFKEMYKDRFREFVCGLGLSKHDAPRSTPLNYSKLFPVHPGIA